MPWGLTRFQYSGQSHFVTFCCYHRRRLLTTDESRRIFESALDRVRRSFRLRVYGYVVMPQHVHILLSEPQWDTLADALKSLKQGVSRRLLPKIRGPLKPAFGLSGKRHFWQKRYYDFNIRDYPQFVEKLRYIHRNPVKAGLCERPEQWEWSSFRHYATGCEGRVEIESEGRHENANEQQEHFVHRHYCPTQAKTGLEWATRPSRREWESATTPDKETDVGCPILTAWCPILTSRTLRG